MKAYLNGINVRQSISFKTLVCKVRILQPDVEIVQPDNRNYVARSVSGTPVVSNGTNTLLCRR